MIVGGSLMHRFYRKKLGLAGLLLVTTIVVAAITSPLIAPFASLENNLSESLKPPSHFHLFGTDELGRDILSEMLWGARTTLQIVAATVLASLLVGVFVGAVAGYWGGILDSLISRLIDGFLVVPSEILAIVLVALLGPSRSNVVIALTILAWPSTARLVRGEYISLRNRPFVEAARMAGLGKMRIAFGEILPSAFPLIVVNATFLASDTILAEAGLSFLGLNDPNVSSWGRMIFNSLRVLRFGWWTAVFPGLAIVLLVLGLNFIGDAANDVINPRSSKLGSVRHRRWKSVEERTAAPEEPQEVAG